MNDSVIEIVQNEWIRDNLSSVKFCDSACSMYRSLCKMAEKGAFGSYQPTDKCPGPGLYRLVRVEEE